jgi:hypothetical protein
VRITLLLSQCAENRKRFFELIEAIERESQCSIDAHTLTGLLDAHYPGRPQLTNTEARLLLMAVSYPVVDMEDDGENRTT